MEDCCLGLTTLLGSVLKVPMIPFFPEVTLTCLTIYSWLFHTFSLASFVGTKVSWALEDTGVSTEPGVFWVFNFLAGFSVTGVVTVIPFSGVRALLPCL